MTQPRRVGHHLVRNAGQHGNERRDVGFRIDQGLKLTEYLTAAYLHSTDLGDHVRFSAAGGFKINNTECDLGQMRPKIIE